MWKFVLNAGYFAETFFVFNCLFWGNILPRWPLGVTFLCVTFTKSTGKNCLHHSEEYILLYFGLKMRVLELSCVNKYSQNKGSWRFPYLFIMILILTIKGRRTIFTEHNPHHRPPFRSPAQSPSTEQCHKKLLTWLCFGHFLAWIDHLRKFL